MSSISKQQAEDLHKNLKKLSKNKIFLLYYLTEKTGGILGVVHEACKVELNLPPKLSEQELDKLKNN